MQEPNMLYRYPSTGVDELYLEGATYDTIVVDAPDVDAALANGWFRVWVQAKEAHAAEDARAAADSAAAIAAQEAAQAASAEAYAKEADAVADAAEAARPRTRR